MLKHKKLLVDTSAVPPAIRHSSGPHIEHFDQEVADGILCTSTYIRKEALRLWVCEVIELAQLVDMSPTVSDAFSWWSDKFGRKPKIQGFVDVHFLRQQIQLKEDDPHGAAVELAQFALDVIDKFDLTFKSRTQNSCGCQIGGVDVDADGNALLETLGNFRREFLKDVVGCPVNEYLQVKNDKGRVAKLAACKDFDESADTKLLRAPLQKILRKQGEIRCRACGSIGDHVIALEQPAVYTLIHTDNSFNTLCKCTGRDHHQIRSNASFQPKLPKDQPVVEPVPDVPEQA